MDVITAARALGKEIQKDARYIAFEEARKANEADIELNGMIGKLNLIQLSYQNESTKDEPDKEKLDSMDKEFKDVYGQIMLNDNMRNYEEAKAGVDEMMNYLIQILSLCVNGEDPDTCEPQDPEEEGCTGNCSGCSGCN